MTERWVQHRSGVGEKWEVRKERIFCWDCTDNAHLVIILPKSEYVLCEPPAVWEDITHQVGIDEEGRLYHYLDGHRQAMRAGDEQGAYRFLAASGPSGTPTQGIRVERRVS